ncbi:MAG: hypothetical protein WBQ05_01145, partial [Candidatus Competibacter denitrificans]
CRDACHTHPSSPHARRVGPGSQTDGKTGPTARASPHPDPRANAATCTRPPIGSSRAASTRTAGFSTA